MVPSFSHAPAAKLAAAVLVCLSADLSVGPALAADARAPLYKAQPPVESRWYVDVTADALYAWRNHSSATIIQGPAAAPLVTGEQLAFDPRAGLDARLRAGRGRWSAEARYFGARWKESRVDQIAGAVALPTNPLLFAGGPFQSSATLKARLESWEANLRWQWQPNVTLFAGARWIDFHENLDLIFDFAGSSLIGWSGRTRAIGPQIGAEARLIGPATRFDPLGGIYLDVDARVALLNVRQSSDFQVIQAPPTFAAAGSSRASKFAYELGATVGCRLMRGIDIRAGYRYFALPGAAFAPDLIGATGVLTGIDPVSRRLDVHAVTLGLKLSTR